VRYAAVDEKRNDKRRYERQKGLNLNFMKIQHAVFKDKARVNAFDYFYLDLRDGSNYGILKLFST
jgi:hypothetical protein